MIEAHIPLSGYNIIFQCRTDYFSMEGKWLGENPSTNPKWHDSGLKEPACFSFPPPPSPFSLPTLKAKQQLEADSSEPCTIPHSLFRHMQPLQLNTMKGVGQASLPPYHISSVFCRYRGLSEWVSQAVVLTRTLPELLTCIMQIQKPFS